MEYPNFPGKIESYHGYPLHRFHFDNCECMVVEPREPRPGREWIWKAEFFEAFPAFELAMLERGFYLAFITVGNTFGCPDALKHWDAFDYELTTRYGFARRAILFGLSRGGLYIYNWSARNTEKVACLYADNAVCDFKSWPGGKGVGPGSPKDWQKLLQDYHFSDEAEALAWPYNPVDNLKPLAAAGIPIIHVAATEDECVPIRENTDLLEPRYRALGGTIEVIRHSGGHHPHGLENPTPLIDFILKHRLP